MSLHTWMCTNASVSVCTVYTNTHRNNIFGEIAVFPNVNRNLMGRFHSLHIFLCIKCNNYKNRVASSDLCGLRKLTNISSLSCINDRRDATNNNIDKYITSTNHIQFRSHTYWMSTINKRNIPSSHIECQTHRWNFCDCNSHNSITSTKWERDND